MEQQVDQAKRALDDGETLLDGVFALVVDIEGTTTPITFVKDTLFPYVLDNLEKYLTDNYKEEETQEDIAALRDLAAKDKEENGDVVEIPAASEDNSEDVIKAVCENVKAQMEKDRKCTALKQLQGHIWRDGYKSGQIKSVVYQDVVPVLRQLKEELPGGIYIYSSGSIEAQKLLFGHTESHGDCTDLFSGFFDTEIGLKTDSNSYLKIMDHINSTTEAEDEDEVLFLTDNVAEAEAAGKAGCRVALVERKGNEPLTDQNKKDFVVITSFGDLYGSEDDQEFYAKHPKLDGNGELSSEEEEELYPGEEEDEEDLGDDPVVLGEEEDLDNPDGESDDLSE